MRSLLDALIRWTWPPVSDTPTPPPAARLSSSEASLPAGVQGMATPTVPTPTPVPQAVLNMAPVETVMVLHLGDDDVVLLYPRTPVDADESDDLRHRFIQATGIRNRVVVMVDVGVEVLHPEDPQPTYSHGAVAT